MGRRAHFSPVSHCLWWYNVHCICSYFWVSYGCLRMIACYRGAINATYVIFSMLSVSTVLYAPFDSDAVVFRYLKGNKFYNIVLTSCTWNPFRIDWDATGFNGKSHTADDCGPGGISEMKFAYSNGNLQKERMWIERYTCLHLINLMIGCCYPKIKIDAMHESTILSRWLISFSIFPCFGPSWCVRFMLLVWHIWWPINYSMWENVHYRVVV